MQCRNCPYSKQSKDDADEFELFLWCDKVGGKVYWFGYCEDAFEDLDSMKLKNSSKQRRRNKRERNLKYKEHLKYLAKTYSCYPPPAMPVNENGCWNFNDPVGTVYYRRTHKGNHKGNRYTYFKKYSNKKVRRYKGEIHNGGSYKKIFDYWWVVD